MITRFILVLSAILIGIAIIPTVAGDTLTYPDLVHRLTDLQYLAVLPPDGENTSLASSHDRASQYDAAQDKYIRWDANNDGNGIVRREGDTVVLAEMKGPGCIWRIWSASPGRRHVKIYLDGTSTPVIDLPFEGYFDGKTEPFTRSNLVYRTGTGVGQASGGWNNYTPIPFQKSCKIVAENGWGLFYHFNYTQFAPGTVVPMFDPNLSPENAAALDQANSILGRCGQDPAAGRKGQAIETLVTIVPPGQKATVLELTGPQAITALNIKLDLPSDPAVQRRFLRQLALQITWDDDDAPSVWSPLGDFYGFVGGGRPFNTLPVGFSGERGFYSYWYMPFATKARIEAINDSDHPVTLSWHITCAPIERPIASLGRFHAKWHRDAFLPERADRWPDWTLLSTRGRGRFVGTHLDVWNTTEFWWGEGDEKFFVDAEKFPSSFGTGSEDYFGFAWGRPEFFSRPFHSQPLNINNRGHVDVNRWHITDNVPFQKAFEGCIEKYQDNRGTRYSAVAFWYLAPGGVDPYLAQSVEDRTDYWIEPLLVPDVIKGDSMQVVGKPLHGVDMSHPMYSILPRTWSGDSELWWQPQTVGEHLDLKFAVEKSDAYRLLIRLTKAGTYGIVQLSVDGKNFGPPLDLFNRDPIAVDPFSLGTLNLGAGDHILGATVVGKNPASTSFSFGFDWIKLEPKPSGQPLR